MTYFPPFKKCTIYNDTFIYQITDNASDENFRLYVGANSINYKIKSPLYNEIIINEQEKTSIIDKEIRLCK